MENINENNMIETETKNNNKRGRPASNKTKKLMLVDGKLRSRGRPPKGGYVGKITYVELPASEVYNVEKHGIGA